MKARAWQFSADQAIVKLHNGSNKPVTAGIVQRKGSGWQNVDDKKETFESLEQAEEVMGQRKLTQIEKEKLEVVAEEV